MKKFIIATLAVALAGVGINSYAASPATADLAVSASIAANCTISTGNLAFGAYDSIGTNASAPLDNTGSVTTTCTTGSAVTIRLSQGDNAEALSSDAIPLRQMISGTDLLPYFLYSNAGRTTVWGNDASADVPDVGTGTTSLLTVYGRVPAGQNKPVGSYTDTVVAAVDF